MTKSLLQYLSDYQKLHDGSGQFKLGDKTFAAHSKLFDGSNFTTKLLDQFDKVIKAKGCVRVLDWGCGKAEHLFKPVINGKTLYEMYPGMIQVYYCYDPGNKKFIMPPQDNQMFDIIICADVMEHVPSEYIQFTLSDMNSHLEKTGVALFTISGQLAKKEFMDGENLHVSIYDSAWWTDMLDAHFGDKAFYMIHEGEYKTVVSNDAFKRIAP